MMIDKEKFEKDLAVFSFRQHQDFLTYLIVLEKNGWTIEDAKVWIKDKQESDEKIRESIIKTCPVCGTSMILLSVNTSASNITGDPDDVSVWLCRNNKCMETIYNKATRTELKPEPKEE